MGRVTILLAVTGVAPAVGVSTLTRSLREWLSARGLSVDHLEQDEVYTRAELAPVARELAVRESVAIETLVQTISDFVGAEGDDDSVILLDSLFPFVSALTEWGYGDYRISGFFDEIAERLSGVHVVVVYLDADVDRALRNAEAREPEGWLDWYVDNLASTTPDASSPLHAAADRLERERELTLRLVAEHDWDLLAIPHTDELSADQIFAATCRGLADTLRDSPSHSTDSSD